MAKIGSVLEIENKIAMLIDFVSPAEVLVQILNEGRKIVSLKGCVELEKIENIEGLKTEDVEKILMSHFKVEVVNMPKSDFEYFKRGLEKSVEQEILNKLN